MSDTERMADDLDKELATEGDALDRLKREIQHQDDVTRPMPRPKPDHASDGGVF